MIRLILHGGLGNQIFQLFFAQLCGMASDRKLVRAVTRCLASYSVAREPEISPLIGACPVPVRLVDDATLLEKVRLPKLLQRITRNEHLVDLGPLGLILDGYFQDPDQYRRFEQGEIGDLFAALGAHLRGQGLLAAANGRDLVHMRLTDFVRAGESARAIVTPMLAGLAGDCDIMTDDEQAVASLLNQCEVAARPTLVSTKGQSSWDVLRTMSAYRSIRTNGSSLACWAAALGSEDFYSVNPKHERFVRLLHATRAV